MKVILGIGNYLNATKTAAKAKGFRVTFLEKVV